MSNIISNPGSDVNNIVSTSGIAYVSGTPTWNPDTSPKKARIAINKLTNEVWLWNDVQVNIGDGAWVLYGLVGRMTTAGKPLYIPSNNNEIVLDSEGTAWVYADGEWTSVSRKNKHVNLVVEGVEEFNVDLFRADCGPITTLTNIGVPDSFRGFFIQEQLQEPGDMLIIRAGTESFLIDSINPNQFSDGVTTGSDYSVFPNTGAIFILRNDLTYQLII